MAASTKSVGTHLLNAFRGGLMGAAEVVPGVSGGTVALVTGIYDRLIMSAGYAISGVKLAVSDLPRGRGTERAAEKFRRVHWAVVIAVVIGMATAVLSAAEVISPLVEKHPQQSFAVFFGLVLASLWVPYSSSGQSWRPANYLLALVVAAVTFVVTGLPPTEIEPHPLIVMAAASVAICALVLPGVSGSFMLLAIGLYTTTMDAINERDLGYIGTFALGAIIGLGLFVKLLQWLLERHHHLTLVVMTGLLAGSLRALWPWQPWDSGERDLLAPSGDVVPIVGLMLLGVAIVLGVLAIEHKTHRDDRNPRTTVGA